MGLVSIFELKGYCLWPSLPFYQALLLKLIGRLPVTFRLKIDIKIQRIIRMSETNPSIVVKSLPWTSQVADRKTKARVWYLLSSKMMDCFKCNDNISKIYFLWKLGTFVSFWNNPSTQIFIVLSIGTLIKKIRI